MELGLILVLLTAVLWVAGAILQWSNIRRQERLLVRLRRLSARPAPERVGVAVAGDEPEFAEEAGPVEDLRPAELWRVG